MPSPPPIMRLKRLESESIHILREVVAECEDAYLPYPLFCHECHAQRVEACPS